MNRITSCVLRADRGAAALMRGLPAGHVLEDADAEVLEHVRDISEAVRADNECIHDFPLQ